MPVLAGRTALRRLLHLVATGCHSELELWGYENVFDHPSLPRAAAQFRVTDGRRVAYLDRAYEGEMVDVELDGNAHHSSITDIERDRRRDAWLARLGWLTIRFSRARLHRSPDDARAELRDVLAMRRRQLAS